MGFEFYRDCASTVSLWLLLCLWIVGYLFWWVQRPPVDGCSTANCRFGALARKRNAHVLLLHHLEPEVLRFAFKAIELVCRIDLVRSLRWNKANWVRIKGTRKISLFFLVQRLIWVPSTFIHLFLLGVVPVFYFAPLLLVNFAHVNCVWPGFFVQFEMK